MNAHAQVRTLADLRLALLNSDEFKSKYRTLHPDISRHPHANQARRTVAFIHLQKTGGTSLREMIGRHFPPDRRCPIREDKLHVLSLAELSHYDFFAGHFDYAGVGFIPRTEIQTIAMFREPSARLISFYRFLKSHPSDDEFARDQLIPLARKLTAEEFFERPELRHFVAVNNHYLYAFGRSFEWFGPNRASLSKATLSSILLDAKLRIHALTSLGLTERFRESVELIHKSLNLSPPETIESLHVTDNFASTDVRFQKVESVQLTARLKAAMHDLIEYDNVLYDLAVSEFEQRSQLVSQQELPIT